MANIDNSWVVDIERLINAVDTSSKLDPIWTNQSIYMVPAFIKDLNPTAYKPQIISFGPYHYGDEKLKPMEIHKHRALIHFLKRAQKPLEGFMSALEEVADVLMDSYQSLDKWWRGERGLFLKLILFDGCFMLEVLRFSQGFAVDCGRTDPIFSTHGMLHILPYIRMDMLRIENQLPLLVLKKLVAVETGRAPDEGEMNQLVLDFVALPSIPSVVGPGLHPLDLFHKSCLQNSGDRTAQDSRQSCLQRTLVPALAFLDTLLVRAQAFLHPLGTLLVRAQAFLHPLDLFRKSCLQRCTDEHFKNVEELPCGTLLVEKGIRFRKSKTDSLLDICFADGVLSLPAVTVDDTTECVFLNLLAFERLHVGAGNQITSYIFFMDSIVDSAEDVTLLASKEIIHNAIGTDKAVAKLFNSLGKYVSLDPWSGPSDVLRRVDKYYKRGWNKWRAKTTHFFCKSLWADTVAAFVVLLLLTLLQTVYTVLQYHTRPC